MATWPFSDDKLLAMYAGVEQTRQRVVSHACGRLSSVWA
jgi:hypothetical protein